MAKRTGIILFWIIILAATLYYGNIKPFFASMALAKGNFTQALSLNTFINYEAVKVMAEKAVESKNSDFVIFAKKQIEKEIKARPNDVKLYIHLAQLSYRLGQKEDSILAAKKAVFLAPNRPDLKQLLFQVEKSSFEK